MAILCARGVKFEARVYGFRFYTVQVIEKKERESVASSDFGIYIFVVLIYKLRYIYQGQVTLIKAIEN